MLSKTELAKINKYASRVYPIYYLYTLMDFKKPLPFEKYVSKKIGEIVHFVFQKMCPSVRKRAGRSCWHKVE